MKFKTKAMRAGVWFRSLPRIDRALIDLTIKVAIIVRSVALAKCVFAIIRKLDGILESGFRRVIREVGLALAQRLSEIAQKWGHPSAKKWASDLPFMAFLAVMHTNDNKTFGC